MTESVIVYRNRSEQAMDEMLYDSGAGAWLVPIVTSILVGAIVGGVLTSFVNRMYRRHAPWGYTQRGGNNKARSMQYAANGVGILAGAIAFYVLAKPLI